MIELPRPAGATSTGTGTSTSTSTSTSTGTGKGAGGESGTGGGIIGLVTKVISDNEVQVELAEGVRVRIIKQTITDIVTRGESVRGSKDASDDDDKPMLPPAAPAAERKSLLGSLFGGKK